MTTDQPPSLHDSYVSPLAGRYASKHMQQIWSARHKYQLWRKIWLAVAEAQHEVGLPVSKEQVDELRANLDVTDADIARASQLEKELRHDVMSHVHAWGERCPNARGIIHLGMTSQDVNDNCELTQIQQAIDQIVKQCRGLMSAFHRPISESISTPTTGYTHYQPAQPTTVGRRLVQMAYEVDFAWTDLQSAHSRLVLRGLRGATGTQASFLKLCSGDEALVDEIEARFVWKFLREVGQGRMSGIDNDQHFEDAISPKPGFPQVHSRQYMIRSFVRWETRPLTGQTYSRLHDAQVLANLAVVATSLHKLATDIRLLCNLGELSEPFETKQIGSSAMPYKRNPMRCERVCGLTRFVWNLVPNAYDTAATQWLERTLDDSSNRRLVLPEAFLALDAALNIMHNVISGLVVHDKVIARNLERELPFLATEALMMAAVKLGRDRQDVHEAIRQHAMAAKHRMVEGDGENDLVDRLRDEPLLEGVDIDAELKPERHIGLAVEQTERFLKEVIDPLKERFAEDDDNTAEELRV